MYYIYLIHNLINNKVYVGKTNHPVQRWYRHRQSALGKAISKFYVHKAMAKYGIENFSFTVFQSFENQKDSLLAETYWIKFFKSKDKQFGYNLTDGGEGCAGRKVSEETREKMREKAIGRKHSAETIKNMSGDNNFHSKLNSEQIQEIRFKYNIQKFKLIQLSREYNISERNIARIVYNKQWYDPNYIPPIPRKINNNGVNKLNLEKANEIRKLFENGMSHSDLAKLFSVTITNISFIIENKIWKNK